ncbi:serine/threonine protein kinase [Denitrobaculum tricleocarpae]|uniref:Protein kinase n=1 Tax=Denitrobaculum tricleocarpae TaxID=2591009 RepID=A0A545TQ51_9PROT|nr:serine/threonine protein kinase [Denitrobaculum tricleocarpae]TQV79328.1 protein kinase [Denitrobaculum tricleocarpae]
MSDTYHHNALSPGATVDEYRLIEVLGEGGFGIVYRGEGRYLGDQVAIKEYLPRHLATRTAGTTVAPTSSDSEEAYAWGLKKFQEEARILWNLAQPNRHPNIVAVRRFFEANGTTYMVMDFEEARPLSELLKGQATLPQKRLETALFSLLSGLKRVHAAGVWHRDIKPANILIRDDGSPVLLDFGAARQTLDAQTRSIVAAITPPYAAFEQYAARGNDGPWTDIYALGVTLYRCITGKLPPDSAERLDDDKLTPLSEQDLPGYTPAFLAAVDKALAIRAADRPQSVDEWLAHFDTSDEAAADTLDSGGDTTVLRAFEPGAEPAEPQAAEAPSAPLLAERERISESGSAEPSSNRRMAFIGASIALVIAGAVGATLIDPTRLFGDPEKEMWHEARDSGDVEIIADYIQNHPDGTFRLQAEALLARIRQEIATEEARQATAEADKLAQQALQAKTQADEAAWADAQSGDSAAAYNTYLAAQPQGGFVEDARRRLAELEQEQQRIAQANAEADARAAELEREQERARAEAEAAAKAEAQRATDQAAAQAQERAGWEAAQSDDSIEAYQDYLAAFAEGDNAAAARQRIAALQEEQTAEAEAAARLRDTQAWTEASRTDTLAAYSDYIRDFPSGEYSDEAQTRMDELLKPVVTEMDGRFVARRNANMRSKPSLEGTVLGSLKTGNEVQVSARVQVGNDTWLKIERGDTEAFVYGTLLREIDREEIVAWNELRILVDETFGEAVPPGDKVAAISTFLNRYPDSHRAAEAEQERNVLRRKQAELDTQRALEAEAEQRAWSQIEGSDDPASFRGFLVSYPEGDYADRAQAALDRLAAQEAERTARAAAEAEAQRLREARERAERELAEKARAEEAARAQAQAANSQTAAAQQQAALTAFPAPSISREDMQAFFEDKEYVLREIITDYNRENRIHVRGAAAEPRATKIFSLEVGNPLPPSVGDGRYADVTFAVKDKRFEIFRPFRFGILWNNGEPEIISHSRLR